MQGASLAPGQGGWMETWRVPTPMCTLLGGEALVEVGEDAMEVVEEEDLLVRTTSVFHLLYTENNVIHII